MKGKVKARLRRYELQSRSGPRKEPRSKVRRGRRVSDAVRAHDERRMAPEDAAGWGHTGFHERVSK